METNVTYLFIAALAATGLFFFLGVGKPTATNRFIQFWGDNRFKKHPVITVLVQLVGGGAAYVALLVPGLWGALAATILCGVAIIVLIDGINMWRRWRSLGKP